MGAHLGGPQEMKSWVVVTVWVGLNLNPHPFKSKRVRHPRASAHLEAGRDARKLKMGFCVVFYAVSIACVMAGKSFERGFGGRKLRMGRGLFF
jgi:hypothetical protein